MKKRLALIVALILVVVLAFTGCEFLLGKTITKMEAINLDEVLAEIGEIKVDDEPDFSGLMVRVNYSDGSFKMIGTADGLEIKDIDTSKSGAVTVKFSFEDFEGSFTIQVNERTLESIEVDSSALLKEVIIGEFDEYDASGIKVTAKYADGTDKLLSANDYQVELPDFTTPGAKKITVTYQGKTAEIAVNVKAALAISVDHSGVVSDIVVGDSVDISGIVVKLVYSDGSEKLISASEYTTNLAELDFATAGKKTVVVTYGDFTDDFDINVKAGIGLTVDASLLASVVMSRDELDLSLLVVTLKYSDNSVRALDASEYTTDIDSIDFTTGGAKTVRVSFENYSATFGFTVKKATSIEVDASLVNKTVMTKDELDLSKLVVTVKYNVGADETLAAADYTTNIESLDFTAGGALTVTVSYGALTDTFDIFVKKEASISVDASLLAAIVMTKDELDLSKLVVTLKYNDNSTATVTAYTTNIDDIDFGTAGLKTVTVSYNGFTTVFSFTVKKASSINVDASALSAIVMTKDELDLSKLVVTVKYNVGADETLAAADYTTNIESLDFTVGGELTVTVTYGDLTDTFDIFVKKATGIQLDAEGVELDLTIEQEVDYSLLKVYLVYNIGEPVLLESGYAVEELNRNDAATRKLVVSYEGFTAELKVEPATLSGITVTGTVAKVLKGETPDYSNLTVVANFSNGSSKTLALSDVEFSVDTSVTGIREITVSYEDKTATAQVLVYAPESLELIGGFVNSVRIDKVDEYSIADLRINLVYTDNTKTEVAYTTNLASLDLTTAGNKTLVVSAEGLTLDLTIEVVGVQSITINGINSSYKVENVDLSSVIAHVVFSNNEAIDLELSEINNNLASLDLTTYGAKTLTVEYYDGSASAGFTVHTPAKLEVVGGFVGSVYIDNASAYTIDGLKIRVVYTDDSGREVAYTTNIASLDFTTAGNKTLVVSAEGLTLELTINVVGIKSLEIAGVKDSYKDEAADLSGVTVKVTYADDTSKFVSLADTQNNAADLDFATAGTKALSVSYYGASIEKSFEIIKLQSMAVTNGAPSRVVAGDTVTINGIVVTATYTDGSKKTYTLGDVTGAGLDFSKAGNVALSYTIGGVTYTHNISVVEVTLVTLENVPALVYQGDTIDLSGVIIKVTYSDGETATVSLADCTSVFDSSVVGEQTLTITYRGVAGNATVLVKAKVLITGVEFAPTISSEAKKSTFIDKTGKYTVGDDNAFRIQLSVTGIDMNDAMVNVKEYVGKTSLSLIEGENKTLLSGSALATYAVIDENNHTIDFTDAAVGKTFELSLGVSGSSAYTAFQVDVKDAYNIYNAKELNFITNGGSFYGADDNNNAVLYYNYDEVTKFLEANDMVRPEKFAGIVLHGDMIITENDLPAGYLHGYKDANGVARVELYDYMDIYYRELAYGESFSVYGNFFTVNSYYVPTVISTIAATSDRGFYNDDEVSNSQLFHFWGTRSVTDADILPENYDHTTMKVNIENTAFIDSRPNSNDEAEIDRSKLGLIGIKTSMNETNMTNVNMQRYFISYMADHDYHTSNLVNCNLFNSWQNHIFVFGNNEYARIRGEEQQAPNANHKPVTVNITSSILEKSGGPAIIAQHAYVNTDNKDNIWKYRESNTQSGPVIHINSTKIESFVAGTEAWFDAYPGSNAVAAMIKAMNKGFENLAAYGISASFAPNNKAITGVEGVQMMNLQILLMSDGFDINALTNPAATPYDIDGLVTFDGIEMINLNDAYGVDNYANPMLVTYCQAIQQTWGMIPPVFKSSAGGWCFSDGAETIGSLVLGANGMPTGEVGLDMNIAAGNELSLMYKGVGILFGYYH